MTHFDRTTTHHWEYRSIFILPFPALGKALQLLSNFHSFLFNLGRWALQHSLKIHMTL